MSTSVLTETAEAAWDEDGASPAREALTVPFHAHTHPHDGTPRHPSAGAVVTCQRVTGP